MHWVFRGCRRDGPSARRQDNNPIARPLGTFPWPIAYPASCVHVYRQAPTRTARAPMRLTPGAHTSPHVQVRRQDPRTNARHGTLPAGRPLRRYSLGFCCCQEKVKGSEQFSEAPGRPWGGPGEALEGHAGSRPSARRGGQGVGFYATPPRLDGANCVA
jgi:hypothetical protein